MRTYPDLIVCHHCDRVFRRLSLARGESAHCDNCESVLYHAERINQDQWLALTLAAATVFVMANAYPIIEIRIQGLHNQVTLWESVAALANGASSFIAIPTALVSILVPFLQILLLGWVLLFIRFKRRPPAFATIMRGLNALRPWSMAEVCLLAALVAVVKLSGFLSVIPGIGIWALAVLTILIAIIANYNVHSLWHTVEKLAEDTL